MAVGSEDNAIGRSYLRHHGTISPDGTALLGNAGDNILGFDALYPFPASRATFDATPSPLAGGNASTADIESAPVTAAPAALANASSGLIIQASYDSSITDLATSNPTLYTDVTGAITAAVEFYETHITNPITITIDFGYGEVHGASLGGSLGSSRANGSLPLQSYSEVRTLLDAAATSTADLTAISNLPTNDPTGGGTFFITNSELKALGLGGFTFGVDGYVGISSTQPFTYDPANRAVPGKYDAIGVLEHEISEAMGRLQSLGSAFGVHEYTPLDLFRYSGPGTRDLTPGPGYFSIDGGTTNFYQFNDPGNGGDAGDWANSVAHDSYDASSAQGAANVVSATDLSVMDVLGYTIATACFAAGTHIRTERGAVAVEVLRVGDHVPVVMRGKAQAIVWLGHRRVDCRRHPDPKEVWPICVGAGAFGPGRPFRDLFLSPDHALLIDGVLIPVRYLVNGLTIRQEPRDEVTYWHVELAGHDVLYAEGVPAESYLDTGNRGAFANGRSPIDLYPDFARRIWETQACAPLVLKGRQLTAAKQRLLARAGALGHRSTDHPDLRLLADRSTLNTDRNGQFWRAQLPQTAERVRLVSRAWTPAHMRPDSDDCRTLGVAISRLWLDRCEVPSDSPVLSSGWLAPEPGWRWTNGNALLATTGAQELAFEVAITGTYWTGDECERPVAPHCLRRRPALDSRDLPAQVRLGRK